MRSLESSEMPVLYTGRTVRKGQCKDSGLAGVRVTLQVIPVL